MVYYSNVPQDTDKPSVSAGQFRSNFTDLETVFNDNHIGFAQAEDRGEHRKVTFNSVIADPAESDPKTSLYIKTAAGDSELFFEKYDNGLAANEVRQMTNLPITTAANAGTAGGNISYIDSPWGLRFIWGLTAAFSGSNTIVVPAGTTIVNYQLTGNVSTGTRNPINGGTVAGLTLSIRTIDNVSVRYFILGTY